MLVSKGKATVGDICTIRLVTGEEMIAKLVDITEDTYLLGKALVLHATDAGAALSPATFTGDDETGLPVLKTSVMWVIPTKDEFKKAYIQQTSGIIT